MSETAGGSGPPPTTVASGAGRTLHRRLAVNSLSNLLRYGVSVLLAFFLTPFVIRTLGDSVYGFWVMVLAFVGYAGILELGVQPTVVKMVGQHRGGGDLRKLEEILGSAFAFFLGMGALSSILFAVLVPPVLSGLAKDAPAEMHSQGVFLVVAIDVFIMFLNIFFTGILYGWQLYKTKNLIDMGAWTLNAILLVVFLDRGGILLLVLAKTATDFLALGATLLVVHSSLPRLRLYPRSFGGGAMSELLRFGGRLFIGATTSRVAMYAYPLVVSSRISTAATAFFAIPVRLVDYVREITWSLAAGFMPAFSELDARRERSLLRMIYLRYSRYLLVATMPIYAILMVYGAPFIGLWIGPEYAKQAAVPILFIAAAALVENLQPLYWRLCIGVGLLDRPIVIAASCSLASIVIAFLLAPSLGITGPALAIFGTTLVAQVLYLRQAAGYLEDSVMHFLTTVALRPFGAGVIVAGVAVGVKHVLGTGGFLNLGLGVLICAALYVPLAYGLTLDGKERLWIRSRLAPRLRLGRLTS